VNILFGRSFADHKNTQIRERTKDYCRNPQKQNRPRIPPISPGRPVQDT